VSDREGSGGLIRISPSHAVQRELWAKAAGRCTICARYLLDGSWDYETVAVGQLAHIIGATDGAGSPRGQSALPATDRASASNLMLLCQPCHQKIDRDPDHWPLDYLQEIKDQFEARVRAATDFASLEQTVVIRLTSPIRGNSPEITNTQVSDALQHERLTYAGEDVREATRRIALSEPEDVASVWSVSADRIARDVVRAQEFLADSAAQSISVFALAPVPMLVQLGAAIGTKQTTHVFEPHRREGASTFIWPADTTDVRFEILAPEPDAEAEDVVVLVSLTAEVQFERAPEALRPLPTLRLRPVGGPRLPLIRSREDLHTFAAVWREALQTLEERLPRVRQLHLLAATPVSAAIELGRHRMRDAHPDFVVYQLVDGKTYEAAITISG
jgi:hypothetical protein